MYCLLIPTSKFLGHGWFRCVTNKTSKVTDCHCHPQWKHQWQRAITTKDMRAVNTDPTSSLWDMVLQSASLHHGELTSVRLGVSGHLGLYIDFYWLATDFSRKMCVQHHCSKLRSTSEVTTLWHCTSLIIIIIIMKRHLHAKFQPRATCSYWAIVYIALLVTNPPN